MFCEFHDHIIFRHYEELKSLAPLQRQVSIFKYYLAETPVSIREGAKIQGWYGYEKNLPPAEKRGFEPIHVLTEEEERLYTVLAKEFHIQTPYTYAHTCIDYGTVAEKGLVYYLDKVSSALETRPGNEYLLAMGEMLRACGDFAARFGQTRVPMEGARSFREAVQSVWFMHSLIPIAEMSWASISLGRLDQYLYPFYRADLERGTSREEMKQCLRELFVLLDSYGDGACALNIGGMDKEGKDQLNDLSLLLIEVEKELALRAPIFTVRVHPNMPEEVLDALIDFRLFSVGQPTFYGELPCRAAVMGRGVPEKDAAKFSTNSCMGLVIPGEEIADMWGVTFHTHLALEMAVNDGEPLHGELPWKAIPSDVFRLSRRGGPCVRPDTTLETVQRQIKSVKSESGRTQGPPLQIPQLMTLSYEGAQEFESLYERFEGYLAQLFEIAVEGHRLHTQEAAVNHPDPLLSALTAGCIENAGDRALCARYYNVTVETMGLVNTVNALEAIRELVFEKKKYTLADLVSAAKANYEGWEELRGDILACRKYGEDDETVNALCRRVGNSVAEVLERLGEGNTRYLPSLHTIDSNVWFGLSLPATLDGRLGGEPVNKNANPSYALSRFEPTAVALSAAALPQTRFSGGQPIDLYFDRSALDTKVSRDKIKALICTYFDLGGLQLQVNSVNLALLEKAHSDPEKYPEVIIRKGGYSVYFRELPKAVRAEFLEKVRRGNV